MPGILLGYGIILVVAIVLLMLILLIQRVGKNRRALNEALDILKNGNDRTRQAVQEEIVRNREETTASARQAREELSGSIGQARDDLLKRIVENAGMQKDQLDSFSKLLAEMTRINEKKLEQMRQTMENKLQALQEENNGKLEQIRIVVDEKLQTSLDKRLGESFKQVSERLEQVYKGLGEMRNLASGVGDLKKVLVNVKTRGVWGEIQLGNILEQILTSDQYDINVVTKKGGSDRVEFAVKLPGPETAGDKVVWLPIDAKFPQEDYQRLVDAQERADKTAADRHMKNLENRIKTEAKSIKEKYIDPPNTTDFGIMFLPVEGLYAEVLRRPGLCDVLQRDYRIAVAGPTTLAALLNSLQMGFRTLAIEKRSSEVWEVLGKVKTEFGSFGAVLARTKKKLQEASTTIYQAEVRTRAIERKLKDVQEIPQVEDGQ
jgi:DNA recombination protein RmuC